MQRNSFAKLASRQLLQQPPAPIKLPTLAPWCAQERALTIAAATRNLPMQLAQEGKVGGCWYWECCKHRSWLPTTCPGI